MQGSFGIGGGGPSAGMSGTRQIVTDKDYEIAKHSLLEEQIPYYEEAEARFAAAQAQAQAVAQAQAAAQAQANAQAQQAQQDRPLGWDEIAIVTVFWATTPWTGPYILAGGVAVGAVGAVGIGVNKAKEECVIQ